MSAAPISKLAGVCGWPIHHSLSPILHNYWLRESGIKGAYIPFMVKPWEARKAFSTLPRTNIAGVNVTLPLKGEAFLAADEHSEDALRIGAANCLYVKNGKIVAHNTDLEGFSAPLIEHRNRDDLTQICALVVGAGGAAKAVIAALLGLGVPEIILINRTDSKAEALVAEAGLPSFYTIAWSNRSDAVKRADLIVNASAAGMSGFPALDLDLTASRPTALIYDLIYTPELTPLLKQAEALGLETLGGMEMLIGQAKPSFELFYRSPVPEGDAAAVLRQAIQTGQR